jgi:hypothetical protein
VKKTNCEKWCKKPLALRESKYCEKWCHISDDRISFSCDMNLDKSNNEKDKNLLNCMFHDIKHYSACKKCPLACDRNENPNQKEIEEQNRKLDAIIEDLKKSQLPVNINPERLKDISKSFKDNKENLETTKEAIEAVNIARNILEGLSEGRTPDPSSFAIMSHHFKRKFRKRKKK